ncbi:hypothetical protein QOZ80_6AG0513450 [Eleusine coracana subsp. coracana]|nr:hypothetical protein QOZ80_6AG0513450 [Eleusine coracana subsp. coracana]
MRQRESKMGVDGAATPRKEHQHSAAGRWLDAEAAAALAFPPRTKRPRSWAVNVVLVAFFMTVPPIVFLLGARTSAPAVWISSLRSGWSDGSVQRWSAGSFDKLLGGLLADGFDERSCHSRYQSAMYRRNPGKKPSPYLVSKLRQQEALQRRCGPGTVAYSTALELLRSGKSDIGSPDCKYLVSISYSGLGNRILAAAAAFMYALLTDRVFLVDPSNEMGELFCEPFPGTTWLLPPGFPLTSYTNFSIDTTESYGNMLKNKVLRNDVVGDVPAPQMPVFAYIHLNHDATQDDKFFYCDEDQRLLRNVPWLVMRTDNYIVPGMLLDAGFQEEFARLFPEPDTVFHHLGRYLFHPSNHVWGLITRYYDAYLAAAQRRVGIQVRVFGEQPDSPELLQQITKCTQSHGVIPELLTGTDDPVMSVGRRHSTAVLVTSLKSWYSEKLKSMYWEQAAATGDAFGAKSHDTKAWAEIYLLSLTDTLVTTAWSTFGYVAQGLGGQRPLVMYRPENDSLVPDPPCGRDVSMDPCFHAPPFYDCRLKHGADTGKIVPHVKHCIDMSWGSPSTGRIVTGTACAVRRSLTQRWASTSLVMRQLEVTRAVVGAEGPARKKQRSVASGLLDAKETALVFTSSQAKRPWRWAVNAVLAAFFMIVPPMVILFGARASSPPISISAANVLRGGDGSPLHWPARSYDKLHGGLLADGFDEGSCHSRYQSAMYRRNAGRKPSAYLVSKLRQHEALQRRCGPGTVAYSNALEQLRSGKSGDIGSQDCKYLVSISYRGVGNRILATASAFMYALLTGRVLLVDPSNELGELFCEPFPDTTWLLPPAFPLTSYTNFSLDTVESYGNMLKNKVLRTDIGDVPAAAQLPVFAYIHLDHDATQEDKFFYCDEDQSLLRDIPWLVMRTDCYIVPGLYLDTGFREELARLFPEPDTVFHHLGRYLFHPSNHVWGLITRYYDAYLATAQRRVGIQVRVFGKQPNSPALLEQITKCTQRHGLLPKLLTGTDDTVMPSAPSRKSTAVLVTSLKSWYSEKLKSMYWENAAITGDAVSVNQPSQEGHQHFGAKSHDAKAWAEIYLLSLTDTLVTTAWSTFGYVAQGFGGLRPWVMYRPENDSVVPDPPCGRDVSMDPCFHAPPFYDCRLKHGADTGKIVPQVKHCIDMSWGLKLVDNS